MKTDIVNNMQKHILIIEDESIVAKDIAGIVERAGYKVTGIGNNFEKGLSFFKANIPDLLICDINLGNGKTGINLIEETRKIKPVPVLYLTAYTDNKTVDTALETLPESYLTKPFTKQQLLISVNRILKKNSDNTNNKNAVPAPTKREMDIIYLIANGESSKSISEKLCISFETVHTHRKNLFHKYNVKSSSELIALAHKNKWLK